MSERWGREQVLGLAPDAPSRRAAGTVAKPAKWSGAACDEGSVWGQCQGSATTAYRASVDLSEPAFRCSCPSRKFPCKHVLGLLLLWSEGTLGHGAPPEWVREWLTRRRDRDAQGSTRRAAKAAKAPDPRTVERRERRVDDGIEELDQWLRDQVTHGLAQAQKASYQLWDDAARRLVDAQATALAGQIKSLASIPRRDVNWPQRLLEEYALLRLLTTAHRRRDELPEPLRATVRSRIGFPVSRQEVLRGEQVRDHWYVAGMCDSEQDRLTTRRVWLRGRACARSALILSFAAAGRALDASLVVGSTVDAELAFYPAAQPLRALVAARHGTPSHQAPRGTTVRRLLHEHADALSRDPWLDRWPAVLENVRLGRTGDDRLAIVDQHGDALPMRTTDPWRLLAVSGGRPVTVAGEWSPRGLLPLSVWDDHEGPVIL